MKKIMLFCTITCLLIFSCITKQTEPLTDADVPMGKIVNGKVSEPSFNGNINPETGKSFEIVDGMEE